MNYRFYRVVEEMKHVIKYWLEKGANGFRIDAVNHLYEDKDLRDEPLSGLTTNPNSYDYTLHYHTQDLNETYEMVYEWRQFIDQWHKKNGGVLPVLMSEAYANSSHYPRYFASPDNPEKLGSQMPFNFMPLKNLNNQSTAADFARNVNDSIASVPKNTRLNWVMGNHDQPRYGSKFGTEKLHAVMTMVMTLPGVAITYNVSVSCPLSDCI